MKIDSFEFNTRELTGLLGEFGTLLPLANMAVGFVAGWAVHFLLLGKEHRDASGHR
jgi:hypothetical protein